MDRGMVIIGAGECGVRAAFGLRENGYEGLITLVGEELHLPYERPPLSKQAMLAPEGPSRKTIATLERLQDAAISLRLGTQALAIDRQSQNVTLLDGNTLPYFRLLLATGAAPRTLLLPGVQGPRFVTLRTFEDAEAIRSFLEPGRHIAIIGGGFIGLELAASARQRGAGVTLVEAQSRLLSRGVPEAIARDIQNRHETEGVEIRCNAVIEALGATDEAAQITLQGGSIITADLVLIGIGAIPATSIAERAGLAIANGIAVDEHLRTTDPHIFAGGDCCSFPLALYGGRRIRLESWRNAQDQGLLAARNMLGANEVVGHVPWFWSDQYDLHLQIAGLIDEASTLVRRPLDEEAYLLFHLSDDGRLVAASGIGRGTNIARDMKLAEMLIAASARPDPAHLADPNVRLKALLAR